MLESVTIECFRCIAAANLQFDDRATAIVGANAAGKTSLLEAIFFLAHGRSFRSSTRSELIQKGAKSSRIVAGLRTGSSDRAIVAGAEFDGQNGQLRLDARPSAIWQLAQVLPVQVIDPSIHRVLEEGSARRRRLIDWGVFHVKPSFIGDWRACQRVLAQRNAALKSGSTTGPWNDALISISIPIDAARATYIEELSPIFGRLSEQLLGSPAELHYRRGWNAEQDIATALAASHARELRQRTTVVGPHRADIEIRWGDAVARKRVSRGQQKLLASALILAQIELRAVLQPAAPVCLMLDDPAAELDVDNLGKLLDVVARTPAQLVLSSLEERRFSGIKLGNVFHVEQGRFRQVL